MKKMVIIVLMLISCNIFSSEKDIRLQKLGPKPLAPQGSESVDRQDKKDHNQKSGFRSENKTQTRPKIVNVLATQNKY